MRAKLERPARREVSHGWARTVLKGGLLHWLLFSKLCVWRALKGERIMSLQALMFSRSGDATLSRLIDNYSGEKVFSPCLLRYPLLHNLTNISYKVTPGSTKSGSHLLTQSIKVNREWLRGLLNRQTLSYDRNRNRRNRHLSLLSKARSIQSH